MTFFRTKKQQDRERQERIAHTKRLNAKRRELSSLCRPSF